MLQDASESQPEQLTAVQLPTRYDGRLKVTGKATYAAEHPLPGAVYAVMVQSTIPAGAVSSIDHAAADRASGVLAVLTPFNAPRLAAVTPKPPATRRLTLLQDAAVSYNGQPIAVVVASSLEEAQHGARLLRISYKQQPAKTVFSAHLAEAHLGKSGNNQTSRGDVAAGFAKAAATLDATYTTPLQVHNPMEPHATIALWEGDHLHLYDSTQGISGVRQTAAKHFGIPQDNVHVECPYTGGGFGCKGSAWSHVMLVAMAAKVIGKPVKLVLERPQMFGPVGFRPATVQHIRLAAAADGKLTAISHDVVCSASVLEEFMEPSAEQTRMLYSSDANATTQKLVDLNLGVHTFQRAPGEATGTAALEVAMDELAYKLHMDPLQLRLANYAEQDPGEGRPFTSKNLREAYRQAAERFGWARRDPRVGARREGDKLIGWGMATATYPANRGSAQVLMRLLPSGRAWVGTGSQDLGTGTYTIVAQTAANALHMDASLIDAVLGDTNLPPAPVSGGSQSAASVTPAVLAAAEQLKLKLFEMAVRDTASPFHGLATKDLDFREGNIVSSSEPGSSEPFAAVLRRNGNQPIEAKGEAQPDQTVSREYSAHSWGAVFAEVAVDADTHMVQVRRVVATYDIGTLINHTTGLNQLVGGIVWSISTALHEEGVIDPVYGRFVNENLADYHVPVNLDIAEIDVTVLGTPDTKFNPLGARGIGEIGITGAAAAVNNAVYHATGKRIRDYPITPDKLMRA